MNINRGKSFKSNPNMVSLALSISCIQGRSEVFCHVWRGETGGITGRKIQTYEQGNRQRLDSQQTAIEVKFTIAKPENRSEPRVLLHR